MQRRRAQAALELRLRRGLTESILLGNVAIRSGAALEWDAGSMRVTNVESANQFVRDEYAYGFELS